MPSGQQTRSKSASTATSKESTSKRTAEEHWASKMLTSKKEIAEKKLYKKLKACQQEIEKQEAEAFKSNLRKRTTAMAIRDASGDKEEDMEETHKVTKLKKHWDKEDKGNNSDNKSKYDNNGDNYKPKSEHDGADGADDVQIEDDIGEEEPAKERKASGRPKPRPVYKGKARQEVDNVEMEEAGGDEDEELEERERKLAVLATPKKAVPNAAGKQPPSKELAKGKSVLAKNLSGAGHKAGMQKHQPSCPAAGASQASKEGCIIFAGVDVPGKEFANGKKTSSVKHTDKTSKAVMKEKGKKTLFALLLESEQEVEGTDEEGMSRASSQAESTDDDDGSSNVVLVKDKQAGAKGKERGLMSKASKTAKGKHVCNRPLAMNLPSSVLPLKSLTQAYLKLYITLKQAWTSYEDMTNNCLVSRDAVIIQVLEEVRKHCNKNGHYPEELKKSFVELLVNKEAQKVFVEVVWGVTPQMQNDLKKKLLREA